MKALLDTSTLIAAMLSDHVHHAAAQPWLSRGKSKDFDLICSAHSLAETFAVLTRLRRTPMIGPPDALRLIQENIISCAQIVALSNVEYSLLIESIASNKIIGGAVYDAIIARCAELSEVDHLVTLNVAHFRRVWPAGSGRIVSPQMQSPP